MPWEITEKQMIAILINKAEKGQIQWKFVLAEAEARDHNRFFRAEIS